MEIEKSIAFFIEQQFPSIYRQDGEELVQLVRDYYKFLETETNQAHYNSRRYFEYKDVDTTLKSMYMFFKQKYLADLPLKEEMVPFLTKNILDLYRRKGTSAGIEVFFSIFYNEYDVEFFYPASKMLKVSNSKWRRGVYLQLFPNNNRFLSKSEKEYSYADLISRNITGSASGAKAAVARVNIFLIDGTRTPVIYIDEVQGTFEKFDDIITNINGELVSFGRVNGSLNQFLVDSTYGGTTNHEIGDIFNVTSERGDGGKVVVTEVSDTLSGEITYEVEDGGYGYTVENTRLLVSNQTLVTPNPNLEFVLYETIRDTQGVEGIVLGQTTSAVGVLVTDPDANTQFTVSRNIFAVDRAPSTPLQIEAVSNRNDSSPGELFPDTAANTAVKAEITNTSQAEVITDVVLPFVGVSINAADYETAAPMSGSASPVNLSTPLDEAFDIQTLTIGKISVFRNVSPGSGYQTEVFARAQDNVFNAFQRKGQILRFTNPGDAGIFNIDEVITEVGTGIQGEIKNVDTVRGIITVNAYDYYGFSGSNDIQRTNGDTFSVAGVELDYETGDYGDNAVVATETDFATGRIKEVSIFNSGFGYVSNTAGQLVNEEGEVQTIGTIIADTQGFTEGYWADQTSHINGFNELPNTIETPILPTNAFSLEVLKIAVGLGTTPFQFDEWANTVASDGYAYGDMDKDGSITSSDSLIFEKIRVKATDLTDEWVDRWNNIVVPSFKEQGWFDINRQLWTYVPQYSYYDSGTRIQDSDFYQEYSYQIKSTLSKNQYEEALKENVHLAGTKMFGDFIYKVEVKNEMKPRFIRFFNDDGSGSPLDLANVDVLEASVTNFTVDTTFVTADHEPV